MMFAAFHPTLSPLHSTPLPLPPLITAAVIRHSTSPAPALDNSFHLTSHTPIILQLHITHIILSGTT